jgi:hypothetical protein
MMEFQLIKPDGNELVRRGSADEARKSAIVFALVASGSDEMQAYESIEGLDRAERIVFWKGLQLAGWKIKGVRT